MMDRFKESFREEAFELLNSLERSLLLLEETPDGSQEIDAIFRAVHTIKGSSAMFGFQEISHFTHEVENALDLVRDGSIKVNKHLIDLTLQARDHIRYLLDNSEIESPEIDSAAAKLLESFRNLPRIRKVIVPESQIESRIVSSGPSSVLENPNTWRIQFFPRRDIFKNGTRPLQLIAELLELGDCSMHADIQALPLLVDLDCQDCYIGWTILLTTPHSRDDILDIFIFAQDHALIEIKLVDSPDGDDVSSVQLGKILVDRGMVDKLEIDQAIKKQQRLGALLTETGVPVAEINAALEEQEHIRRSRQKAQAEGSANSIRVNSDKLDTLVDLVGELVTLQARLARSSQSIHNQELDSITEHFERLTAEIRDSAMNIRMLPIGTSFTKFKRLVRDLAGDLGKVVEFITEGAETELDKTVLEKLNDPLIHLIRNSLDHGLETPAERLDSGKPSSGIIKLIAEHAGSCVVISIIDDGKGLDTGAIKAKAIERGLITASSILSDQDAHKLIFLPGFSTAKAITSLSGRGVGLDVVKKELENLGGVIEILSIQGMGTTIRLKIPLTLAIIDGLLVQVANEHYVLPLSIVEECLDYCQLPTQVGHNGSMMPYRDGLLPLLFLRELFEYPGLEPELQQVVVVTVQGGKIGIVLDEVIGDHQTVIKNLGKVYQAADGISGASILGDGSVALIIDVNGLINQTHHGQKVNA